MEHHQAEAIVQGLLDGHNLADLFPPAGSPEYVRRLRDQAAMRILANPRPEDVEQALVVAKNNKGDFQGTVRAMLSLWAVELADAGLYALGYDAPTATGRPPETERPARDPKTEETTDERQG